MPGAAESSTTEYHDEKHKVETEDVVMELKTKATSDSPPKRSKARRKKLDYRFIWRRLGSRGLTEAEQVELCVIDLEVERGVTNGTV